MMYTHLVGKCGNISYIECQFMKNFNARPHRIAQKRTRSYLLGHVDDTRRGCSVLAILNAWDGRREREWTSLTCAHKSEKRCDRNRTCSNLLGIDPTPNTMLMDKFHFVVCNHGVFSAHWTRTARICRHNSPQFFGDLGHPHENAYKTIYYKDTCQCFLN